MDFHTLGMLLPLGRFAVPLGTSGRLIIVSRSSFRTESGRALLRSVTARVSV